MFRRFRQIDVHSPVNWSHPLNNGLLGWYYVPTPAFIAGNKILNIASNRRDRQGANDGTVTNGPPVFVASTRNSLAFRQMSAIHYVLLPDGLIAGDSATASGTVSGWIKAENRWTDFRKNLIWSSRNYEVGIEGAQANGGGPYTFIFPPTARGSTTTNYRWTYITSTIKSNGFLRVYANGNLAAETAYTGNFQTQVGYGSSLWTYSDRQVGQGNWLGPYQYDDTKVYNRELSADEIKNLYLESSGGNPNTLNFRRRVSVSVGGFKAYWARRNSRVIGAG